MNIDLEKKIEVLIELITDQAVKPEKLLYTNAEVKEMFSIGDKLLIKWRTEGYLSFSRIGDKYFYSRQDILDFLAKHHRTAFR